jgi:hypothetical protein
MNNTSNYKSTIIQGGNPQRLYLYKKHLYYLSIIKQNQIALNAPLKPKYSPLYFRTGYNQIYFPNQANVPG